MERRNGRAEYSSVAAADPVSSIAIRVNPILPRPPQAARMVGHRPRLRSSKKDRTMTMMVIRWK